MNSTGLFDISLDILPLIASGAGAHTKAITDIHTILTLNMLQLVVYNPSKTASVYLLNFFSSAVLRNRKPPNIKHFNMNCLNITNKNNNDSNHTTFYLLNLLVSIFRGLCHFKYIK